MNTNHKIHCPICQKTDSVILLEELYFGLIEKDPKIISRFNLQPDQIKNLEQQIRPPALERLPVWSIIPPDTIFIFLILVIFLLFLFSDIGITLQSLVFPILVIVIYLLYRRKLNAIHHRKKIARDEAINKAQHAADDWSSYFLCLMDMTIFSGHSNNHFPVSELQSRLH